MTLKLLKYVCIVNRYTIILIGGRVNWVSTFDIFVAYVYVVLIRL